LAQIADGRQRRVLLGAAVVGLLVAQQVIGRATRDALFLSSFPASALPPVMMGASLLSVGVALFAGRLIAGLGPRRALQVLVASNAALLLAEYLTAAVSPRAAAVLVYLQISAAGGTLVSAFWSIVNERFDPWTAKRVVGRLGLGASIGAVAGGLLALGLARTLPIPLMLILMAGFNVLALALVEPFGGGPPARSPQTRSGNTSAFMALREMPYLRLLAVLVALGAATEAILDFVLKARVAASLEGAGALMAFFAGFHTLVGLAGLLLQSLATRPALETLGIAGTLALRPLVVAFASLAGLLDGRLWSALLSRGGHDVLGNSLSRSAYELLFLPLPEREKRATKPVVDVGFDKLGAVLGGALALAAVSAFQAPDRWLFGTAVALSLFPLLQTRRLQRGYVSALSESLRAGRVHLDAVEVVDSNTLLTLTGLGPPPDDVTRTRPGELPGDGLLRHIADLRSGDGDRQRRALRDASPDPALVAHVLPLLAQGETLRDAVRALRFVAPRAIGQLQDAMLDARLDVRIRRRVPRVLKTCPTPRAAAALRAALEDADFGLRSEAARALAALTADDASLAIPRETVFEAVRRELDGPGAGERLDHVFVLLALALDREPLRTAAASLRGSDAGLRGTALEYLDNVLPRDLARRLEAVVRAARV
jgi:hypothetical protein